MKTFAKIALVLALWFLGGYTGFYIAATDRVDTRAMALIVTWIALAAFAVYALGLSGYLRGRRSPPDARE